MTGAVELVAQGWQALHAGRPADALHLGRAAVQAHPGDPQGWLLLGATCHTSGQLGEAVECYQKALTLRPNLPEALVNLGSALHALGRPAEAVHCCERALALRPDFPEALTNLGIALHELGRLTDAEARLRQALALRPDYVEALNNLGNALVALNKAAEAEEVLGRALALRPGFPEAHYNLGNALRRQGRPEEALACFRHTLRLRPDYPEALLDLGNVFQSQLRPGEAEACYRRVLELRPNWTLALVNLGNALQDQGRLDVAADCFRQALALGFDAPEVHYNLGNALRDLSRLGEATACFRQALQRRPDYADAWHNLGNALRELGQLAEARDCFRQALALQPDMVDAHDALLQTLHYLPDVTPADIAAAHAEYGVRHAAPLRSAWRPHGNDRDPNRPLRLGLVSPDFGRHPVGFLLVRAVEALTGRPGEVYCYADRRVPPDDLTARFRAAASVWRESTRLTDEQLTEQVRADAIDVLIDLAGHTGINRLLAFARRPAPVQATWLGYEGTTGLEAMDYLIADERLVPPGAEVHYREKVLRLPGGYACYDPPAAAPEPGPPPALARGHVTIGCFNNPAKLSPPALAAFAAVLKRVPDAHLLFRYWGLDDPTAAGLLRQRLTAAGADLTRVQIRGAVAFADYLAAYNDLDVALDPFPFGGGVTTCDALWMGVPVVTLPQQNFASRHGFSYLCSLGLADDLAARDVVDYVARVAALAQDRDRLTSLRAGLCERMAGSPLCDGRRLADELQAALRVAWRAWACGGER
jgi:predicted O-linked N-acetylglucosamine transferase (SPINDLY family)